MVALPNAPRVPLEQPPAAAPGFAIRLPSAQLGDLIQINCVNRIVGAFRVSSSPGEGFLFFDGGFLVHAVCGAQVGLDAVVVMLGWSSGSVEPCSLPWPAATTIGMGADALLLCAAQRLDERSRREPNRREGERGDVTTKVVRRVSWTEAGSAGAATPLALEAEAEAAALDGSAPPETSATTRSRRPSGLSLKATLPVDSLARLEVTRVTADGNIQTSRSGASSDLADTAFFCQRLASLVGEGLGLGACRALACESAREGIVVFEGRSIIGVRGQRGDLRLVLAKVGLD